MAVERAGLCAERPAEPSPEDLYRTARLIRRFEERAIELVRSGDIAGGIHPCTGQEAVAAGICAALRPDDVVLPQHRAHGHVLAKGIDPARLMAELTGRTTGINRGRGGSLHPTDLSAGVLTATASLGHNGPQATGAAWAFAQAGSDRVAVGIFGDGAVNQGALLESFNTAALLRAPVIFVCENNKYATSLPVKQAVAGSITARAAAFGIPGGTYDGMDPVIVFRATAAAVTRARGGAGPTLLEFSTYRFSVHHTFEFKAGLCYRDEEEMARWRARDPVELQGERIADEARKRIDEAVEALLDDAVRFALDSPKPDPDGALDYIYAAAVRLRGPGGRPGKREAGKQVG
jgi:acetoin:2,6-dichlorophenolindophenol oxidoreductase subunit alpha